MRENWDVVVVGAGPAGAVAARECATRGLHTLVLEKAVFPREKPCGGGVSLAAERLLPDPLPSGVVEVRCSLLRTVHGRWRRELSYPVPFLASVRRAAFDAHLLQQAAAAGATVRHGLEAEWEGSGPREVVLRAGNVHLRAAGVIVADGVTGRVSRVLRSWKPGQLALCLTAEAEMEGHQGDPFRREGIEVHYAFVPTGYGWLFPKSDRLYVGLGAHLPAASGLRSAFHEFVEMNRLRLLSAPRAALVPVAGMGQNLVGDGWLMVGDAAGLADPFSGEGIRYALASGRWAAQTLAGCLQRGDVPTQTALATYPQQLKRAFGSHLAMAHLMFTLLQRFPRALLGIYFRHDEPFRRTLDMLAGRCTYGSLLRWVLPRLPFLASAAAAHLSPRDGDLPGRRRKAGIGEYTGRDGNWS